MDETPEHDIELLDAGEDSTEPFETTEQPFDLAAASVHGPRSYSQALTRVLNGGTTALKSDSSASCRVSSPW
jgi:hypothetical protein